jgi:hypothetical protein
MQELKERIILFHPGNFRIILDEKHSELKLYLQVGLSVKGLANIPRNIYENDFPFIIREDTYQCPSFIAAFLFPRSGQLQVSDSTL